MIAAGIQLFLWFVGLFKKAPPNPTEVVEKIDAKMLKDAANRPTDVNDAIDRL